jgi:hypothetical protein
MIEIAKRIDRDRCLFLWRDIDWWRSLVKGMWFEAANFGLIYGLIVKIHSMAYANISASKYKNNKSDPQSFWVRWLGF